MCGTSPAARVGFLECQHFLCPALGLMQAALLQRCLKSLVMAFLALLGLQPCSIHRPSPLMPVHKRPVPCCRVRAVWGGMGLSSSLHTTARLHPSARCLSRLAQL